MHHDEPAKKSDWQTTALPSDVSTITLNRRFSLQEFQRIQRGLVPKEMEDKWFIYWQDDALFFHRSWSGYCIFVVRFVSEGEGYRMVSAELNRDPDQYKQLDDRSDARLIDDLIDSLLGPLLKRRTNERIARPRS